MTDLKRLLLDRATVVAPRLLGGVLATVNEGGESVGLRITEVEAYEGALDPGSHAYRGVTPRTRPMFGAPPRVYVYLSYGIHSCLNIVCAPEGSGQGCLVRAGEVVWGSDLMAKRRPKARSNRDWARGPGNVGSALGVSVADSDHVLELRTIPPKWDSFVASGADASSLNDSREINADEGDADARVRELFAPKSRLTLYLPQVEARAASDDAAGAPRGRAGVALPGGHPEYRTTARIGVSGPGGDGQKYPWRFYLVGERSVSRHPTPKSEK
ncbi:MAG: DNA-3-methyladenine glycosylase [Actinomycetaceae bacterium]|nr:DNA-3-methyladenine glycosylase [Actinomycetaceae bacterium]